MTSRRVAVVGEIIRAFEKKCKFSMTASWIAPDENCDYAD